MRTGWFKSTFSGGSDDNCVEVNHGADHVEVRHSKHPDGPTITYTPDEWTAFLNGAKAGEFDRP